MVLVYHNITPPEYFVDVHPLLVELCYLGRRELGAYATRCALALGDSEFNRQELGRARLSADRRPAGRPDFDHLDGRAERTMRRRLRRRLDQPAVRRPDHPEQEDRGRHPLLPRLQDRVQPAVAAAAGRLVRRVRALFRDAAEAGRRIGAHDVHFLGHVSNEELAAYYEVADLFLCASEHEGFCVPLIEAFHKRVPVVAYAATAIPATMDGGGVLYTTRIRRLVAALIVDAVVDRRDLVADARGAGRGARRSRRATSAAWCGFVEQVRRSRRSRSRPSPSTSGIGSI